MQAANQQGLGSYVEFVRSVAEDRVGDAAVGSFPKGASGLMQLMPATAAELGVDANDAFENALGGAKYLRSLLIRYHGDSALALAAYNAGPGAVDRFHGIPPYEETRNYVLRVLREYERERRNQSTKALASQNRSARLSPAASRSVSPSPEARTHGIARAHCCKQNQIALFEAAVHLCIARGQRYGRGRRISVFVEIDDDLFGWYTEPFDCRRNNAFVGLVRHK